MGMAGSNHRGNHGKGGAPLRFEIASDAAAMRKIQDIQRQILDQVEQFRYDPQSQFAIKLSLEEGLINAHKHGNKLDPAKKVRVEARVTAAQAEIFIEDEGPGFKRDSVPD